MKRYIRYATIEDAANLGIIHSEASLLAFKNIIPNQNLLNDFSIERRTNRFINELSEDSPKTIIIFEDNEPAGFLSYGTCRFENNHKDIIEIWRIYVKPKYWGCSIAEELMNWAIRTLNLENFTNVELWVLEENIRARRFYEKVGFKPDHTHQIINMGKELKELRYTLVL